MRLLLLCPGCGSNKVVTCTSCAPGSPVHNDGCEVGDLDSALSCLEGAGCCAQDHNHGQAANACPGAGSPAGHPGAPCPHPSPAACVVTTPPGETCPGGHCGKGVPGCAVCRPLAIQVIDLGGPLTAAQ